jgi:hypothetical protein
MFQARSGQEISQTGTQAANSDSSVIFLIH